MPFSVVALAPSKKTNVLFLEKNCAIARVCCEDSAQRKTNKMASEITFVGDEEIQFLPSELLPNMRQALGKNFLDSDSGYEDCTSDFNDSREKILEKSCSEDASDMSQEDFPFRRKKRLRAKKASNYEKIRLKANQAGKEKIHPEKYISSEDVQRLKGSPKDCKMIFQARCEVTH